jgi:hypothetical protein
MKHTKQLIVILFLLFILHLKGKAQITLDTIVHPWNLIGYDFYHVQISNNETKFYFEDSLNNTFSLYNMDFTPFLLNVAVPEPYSPSVKGYEVIYLSRALFDCDTTNIEYAYAAQGGNPNNRTFYIMRTDGTQLFRLDSAIAPYLLGTLNGSQDVRPIINTSDGAKLFLYYPQNTNNLHIYSLCGILPEPLDVFDFSNGRLNSPMVKVFPNPSATTLTFQISLPDNMKEYELVIINENAVEKRREKINPGLSNCVIDVGDFNSGTYYYSLCTKTNAHQSGKFIITK